MTNPNPWHQLMSDGADLLVVGRFRVADVDRNAFLANADRAIDALAAQPGFLRASIGQAVDESELFIIRTEWSGVGPYRRALSAFEVKVHAIPLLSAALDESSAFEVVRDWAGDLKSSAPSGRAADADEVSLGAAAAPVVPPLRS